MKHSLLNYPYSAEFKECTQCKKQTWHVSWDCLNCYKHWPPKDCVCKHAWEEHHHCCIMNPTVKTEQHKKGYCRGVDGEECEATQTNGDWHSENEDERCYCSRYEPFDSAKLKREKNGRVVH